MCVSSTAVESPWVFNGNGDVYETKELWFVTISEHTAKLFTTEISNHT